MSTGMKIMRIVGTKVHTIIQIVNHPVTRIKVTVVLRQKLEIILLAQYIQPMYHARWFYAFFSPLTPLSN